MAKKIKKITEILFKIFAIREMERRIKLTKTYTRYSQPEWKIKKANPILKNGKDN